MKDISLYIHIPFCKQKCFYCDFPSYGGKDSLRPKYIDSLIKEIESIDSCYLIKTIFIGGGTPSYLEAFEMKKILDAINKLNLDRDIEFTVECNPGVLSKEKLVTMKSEGVNRLSFGLQSCDNELLNVIGRIHSYEEFADNFKLAREVGFENINVDLMYGLPNQRKEQWRDTLNKICNLKPEHISAYSLIIEEGTVFYRMYEKNLLSLPSENEEREMDKITKEILKSAGYNQYEISNYALKGKECRHNKVYWNLGEYIGVGSSASSYLENFRISNVSSIEQYINKIENSEHPYDEKHKNSIEDNMEEFMFMGLRLVDGISVLDFKERFRIDILSIYKEPIEKNIKNGMILWNGDKLRLSERGLEMSNEVMSNFIFDK